MASARFALPFLVSGQSQKEVLHNEALQLLELLVQPVIEAEPDDDPPASPQPGQQFLVGETPTGAWQGHGQDIATWTGGGWRFASPMEGLKAVDSATGLTWQFRDGSWKRGIVEASEVRIGGQRVLSSRQDAIGNPTGGLTVDAEARAAIEAMIMAMRAHGLIEA